MLGNLCVGQQFQKPLGTRLCRANYYFLESRWRDKATEGLVHTA